MIGQLSKKKVLSDENGKKIDKTPQYKMLKSLKNERF
jgi:hypothetical protein